MPETSKKYGAAQSIPDSITGLVDKVESFIGMKKPVPAPAPQESDYSKAQRAKDTAAATASFAPKTPTLEQHSASRKSRLTKKYGAGGPK